MNIFHTLFKTSIGKKIVMAVTGFILIGFIVGHLVGNLQIFSHPDKINEYAHFLQSLGPALWLVRAFLLLTVVLHIGVAIALVLENKAARPQGYAGQKTLKASYASRTMRYSGVIVLAFIIYHILHFTVRITHGSEAYPQTLLHGEVVADVHSMMVLGFQKPLVSVFYLISVGLLSWHISHGLASMFQSLGLRSRAWSSALQKLSVVFAVVYFLGNAAIVVAPLSGMVKVQNPALLTSAGQPCSTDCQVCETRVAKN